MRFFNRLYTIPGYGVTLLVIGVSVMILSTGYNFVTSKAVAAPGATPFEQQSLEREKVTQLKRIADALEKIAARK